jgi:nitrogen fixation protein NifX
MTLERRLKLAAGRGQAPGMRGAVKVAFATSDMKHVDQHFGAAESLAVYVLGPEEAALVEVAQFGRSGPGGYESELRRRSPAGKAQSNLSSDAAGRNESRLGAKIDALDGCVAIYCQAVGASAINQLRANAIQAIKVPEGSEIKDLIAILQAELRSGLSTWLARALAHRAPGDGGRFDRMEQEGWVE